MVPFGKLDNTCLAYHLDKLFFFLIYSVNPDDDPDDDQTDDVMREKVTPYGGDMVTTNWSGGQTPICSSIPDQSSTFQQKRLWEAKHGRRDREAGWGADRTIRGFHSPPSSVFSLQCPEPLSALAISVTFSFLFFLIITINPSLSTLPVPFENHPNGTRYFGSYLDNSC